MHVVEFIEVPNHHIHIMYERKEKKNLMMEQEMRL